MAETVGFEPTEPVKAHSISNAANSTTLARFRVEFTTEKKSWRRGWDSNPRYPQRYNNFRDCPIQPLSHLSARTYDNSGSTSFMASQPRPGNITPVISPQIS